MKVSKTRAHEALRHVIAGATTTRLLAPLMKVEVRHASTIMTALAKLGWIRKVGEERAPTVKLRPGVWNLRPPACHVYEPTEEGRKEAMR